jgi:trehalose 6-phosphate phosphatase
VLVDFDGTLAPIVTDPAAARPEPGATAVLERLAGRYGLVAVISGRPVEFFTDLLPASVVRAGLYGLQVVRDGVREDHPASGAWRQVIDDVVASAAASGPEGMHVEPKGLSLTLHYRAHPEIEPAVRAWAAAQAARSGLELRDARRSVELHPPIDADKGTVVDELAGGHDPVLFVGDDVGDLPAFDALDRLAAAGTTVVRGAVAGPEARQELVARADVTFSAPGDVVSFLEVLLA